MRPHRTEHPTDHRQICRQSVSLRIPDIENRRCGEGLFAIPDSAELSQPAAEKTRRHAASRKRTFILYGPPQLSGGRAQSQHTDLRHQRRHGPFVGANDADLSDNAGQFGDRLGQSADYGLDQIGSFYARNQYKGNQNRLNLQSQEDIFSQKQKHRIISD